MWGKGKENSRITDLQSNWLRLEEEDPGSREMFPGRKSQEEGCRKNLIEYQIG